MDREQEQMQFLGLYDIFKESCKIILSLKKIFTQITLTLILPLTFIFLAHLQISDSLFQDINHTELEKAVTQRNTRRYTNLSKTLSSEWITFWLFKVAYFTIFFVLSLLATAAVVYTIASFYTGRELTFKNVMNIVPKIWKRLLVTFAYMFLVFLGCNFVLACVIFIFWMLLHDNVSVVPGDFLIILCMVIYMMAFLFVTAMLQLANVVSVLESTYGFKAMEKSMELIKGNRCVAILIFLLLNMWFIVIQFSFESLVVDGSLLEAWKRVGFGVLCFILLLTSFLLGLVIQTVLYLVCKSYHHENINKGDLSNHLESYLGDYKPLNGKDVQLEQYHV